MRDILQESNEVYLKIHDEMEIFKILNICDHFDCELFQKIIHIKHNTFKERTVMILIRFILNFILFGALFYLIWHFFPDTFTILVSWIKAIVEVVQQLLTDLYNKISTSTLKRDMEPTKTMLKTVFAYLT